MKEVLKFRDIKDFNLWETHNTKEYFTLCEVSSVTLYVVVKDKKYDEGSNKE
mgnify:CR=1 FL=1|tara:strand:+ start:817 stop:972 length:156 start_codon:yes stop_codon:yes gene_type:complete